MIKISAFSPTQNFSKWIWEFYDDQLVIKTKSLTVEYDREIKYEKVQSIQSGARIIEGKEIPNGNKDQDYQCRRFC